MKMTEVNITKLNRNKVNSEFMETIKNRTKVNEKNEIN